MINPSKFSPRDGGSPFKISAGPFGLFAVMSPTARIIVLVVLLFLVVGVMVGLGVYSKTPEAREVTPDVPSPEVKEVVIPTGVPALDMTIAERLTDHGPEARRRWPSEAIHYLLLEAGNTPAVYEYAKNLLPITPGSAKEIEKDSHPWRFKFVRFRGELEYLHEEDYEAVYGTPAPPSGLIWRGRVRVSDGDPPLRVVFVTAAMPGWADLNEPHPEYKLITDGWVRGRGILVQNYVDERGGDVPALLVVATKIERDYETVPVKSFDDIPFDIIQDNPSIANQEGGREILAMEYPRPLYRLVAYAEGRVGAPGAELRAEEGLKPEHLTTASAWEKLVTKPADARGKYFGGLGIIALEPLRYVPETITPNDAGVDECLNGWIYTDQRKLLQFIAPPGIEEMEKGTRIRWEGYFYKTKLYPAQDGTERLAPVFVLTVLDEVKPPKSSGLFPALLAGGVVLGMIVLAYLVLREDNTKESYRRLRQKKVAADRSATE